MKCEHEEMKGDEQNHHRVEENKGNKGSRKKKKDDGKQKEKEHRKKQKCGEVKTEQRDRYFQIYILSHTFTNEKGK